MKSKRYMLVVLSILMILFVFVSSAGAADANTTDVLSVDESSNTINEKLALDYSLDNAVANDTNDVENNENILAMANNDVESNENVLKEGTGTYSDLANEIDEAMRSIINECYDKTKKIIKENKPLLKLIAETLLEEETITKEEIDSLVEHGKIIKHDEFKEENIPDKKDEKKEKKDNE